MKPTFSESKLLSSRLSNTPYPRQLGMNRELVNQGLVLITDLLVKFIGVEEKLPAGK